jgi:hypothetical protein
MGCEKKAGCNKLTRAFNYSRFSAMKAIMQVLSDQRFFFEI